MRRYKGPSGQAMPLAVYVYVEVAEGASKPFFTASVCGLLMFRIQTIDLSKG